MLFLNFNLHFVRICLHLSNICNNNILPKGKAVPLRMWTVRVLRRVPSLIIKNVLSTHPLALKNVDT